MDYAEVQANLILYVSLLVTIKHLYQAQFTLSVRLQMTLFPEDVEKWFPSVCSSCCFFSCLPGFSPFTLY